MYLTVRTAVEPLSLARTVQREVWSLDANQPVADVQSMKERVASALAQPRFALLLLGSFAFLALVMAAVGIYGVISYSVVQRSGEIGIRMALGADRRATFLLVIRDTLGFVVLGGAIGLIGSYFTGQLVRSLVFDVSPLDPLSVIVTAGLLVLTAVVAAGIPARRATTVDPVTALSGD